MASARQLGIIYSALAVSSVKLYSVPDGQTLNNGGWAWLAYVLFYPSGSCLTQLDFRGTDVTNPEAVPVRNVVAAQPALYNLLHRTDTALDVNENLPTTYAFVEIQANAVCFASSSLRGNQLWSFRAQTSASAVLKPSVNTVGDLDDAVCIVVPSYGHVWVAKSSILQIKRRPAIVTRIKDLALGNAYMDTTVTFSALSQLLNHVTSLDLFQWGKLNSTEMLEVLRACPALKQLTVQHNGEVFNQWTMDTSCSDDVLGAIRLKSLSLVCFDDFGPLRASSSSAWRTCLCELSSVLIKTYWKRKPHEKSVCQFLHDGYSIDYFIWRYSDGKRSRTMLSYDENRIHSRQVLAMSDDTMDKAQKPMSTRACLAFASAIKHYHVDSRHPNGMLTQDVAEVICSFSTTDVERIVWVDEN